MHSKKTTVSLVLGSGGARGLAHIGIIQWLEEHGYEVCSIAGSSMGALVGGIYAIGKLDEFEKWVRAVTKGDMIALLDFSLGIDGLFKGNKIIDTLKSIVGEKHIENLPVTFTAVASNISQGKEVWFDEGPLFDAIRASISLPLFFTPYKHNGADLIDGGILNPVPIAPTFSDQTDVTIAVNLCARPEKGATIPVLENTEEGTLLGSAIAEFTERIKLSIPQGKNSISAREIVSQSFDAMQGTIARQKIAAYPPDHVIDIPRNLCSLMDFDKAEGLILYGYEKAEKHLPKMLG